MRQDAKTLLDRLDRRYLDYQDFTAAAEEIELWPLFQALLRDPRIIGNREQTVPVAGSPHTERKQASARGPEGETPLATVEARPAGGLFGRYAREAAPAPNPPEPPREPDLRNFLHQLGNGRS
jgi:hypothetical protein